MESEGKEYIIRLVTDDDSVKIEKFTLAGSIDDTEKAAAPPKVLAPPAIAAAQQAPLAPINPVPEQVVQNVQTPQIDEEDDEEE